jgi:hypothetical protein
VFGHGFREAEGSAPLHRRAIQDWLDDRLPENQRGRSFASHPEQVKEQSIMLGSGWRIPEVEVDDSGYSNPRTALAAKNRETKIRATRTGGFFIWR